MILTIRPEHPDDLPVIREVIKSAFKSADHSDHTEHLIVDLLRQEKALSVSRVAELDGRIVGYISASPVTVNGATVNWYGIGPVAVVPSEQHKGLGSKLVLSCIETLQKLPADGAVLLGEPAFYERFGFRVHPELTLPGVPEHYFMALRFRGVVPKGEVRYHRAFGT
ncbi:N-acetyltransferase [Alteromonas aestuariivivens]|uniref:N-acetyltransferase n=1 Tax=Alteromonas aestuariivivens TaxID=1938339 RepID=A0A3D8MBJ3_9ALTE|nr:N-acetyltransferase [Alteromonas aestuariivivens]RDV26782.1 N-acetyltransferase [Alteromonas aestuariivivens]